MSRRPSPADTPGDLLANPHALPREPTPIGEVGRTQRGFAQHARDALAHLDDPVYLQGHALTRFVHAAPNTRQTNLGRALRQTLLDAIESLRPGSEASPGSRALRGYQILRLRFVEKLEIPSILDKLSVSRSVYFVEQQRAVDAVVSTLSDTWLRGEAGTPQRARRSSGGGPVDGDRALDPLPIETSKLNNLSLQLTNFVGRDREVAEVKQLLGVTRLLTLTGSGGCGKTRLALEVAAGVLHQYPDGVWLVELAALDDSALVPQAVAASLGARELPGQAILVTLGDYLKAQRCLLVLDNCEHLIDACADLANCLLRSCPDLTILATSRERLEVDGEVGYRVPSLSAPPVAGAHSPEDLTGYESVELFVDRAVAASPGFRVTDENALAVARVCWRLDGIPLAIELAAAQARVLTVDQIAQRLDDGFRLLRGGSRTASLRHQTLEATMDWSYNLLSEPERALLRRLAVFAGGFTLEAAEVVCGHEEPGATHNGARTPSEQAMRLEGPPSADTRRSTREGVLDLLTRLVDKSLVQVGEAASEARYRLLQTIREYAWERLVEAGEVETVRRRHLARCLVLAAQAEPELSGPDQGLWLQRLEVEHDDLRAALRYCPSGVAGAGLGLAASLWRFWQVRGYVTEGREWLEQMLRAAPEHTAVRAKALLGAALLAGEQEDDTGERALLEDSLALFRELGDQLGAAWALENLGSMARYHCDYRQARVLLEESLALFRRIGERCHTAWALRHLGSLEEAEGEYWRARALNEESLALFREVGERSGTALTLANLGNLARLEGNHERGRALLEESLALLAEIRERGSFGLTQVYLGNLALAEGDLGLARGLLEESLVILEETGPGRNTTTALVHLGSLLRLEGNYERARALLEWAYKLQRARPWDRLRSGWLLSHLGNLARSEGYHGRAWALYRESLALVREIGNLPAIRRGLCLAGMLAIQQEMERKGVRLVGAAATSPSTLTAYLDPGEPGECDACLSAARSALGEEAFANAWAEGQAMTLEQAVEYALQDETEA